MARRDPLVRAAGRIAVALARQAHGAMDNPWCDAQELVGLIRVLERTLRAFRLARGRGWLLAASCLEQDVGRELGRVRDAAGAAAARGPWCGAPPVPPPASASLRNLIGELRQLEAEFGHVEFDLRHGRVVTRTAPLELGGVPLGAFAIELHLGRLTIRRDASCFDCTALQPNPASGNASVTHPHVQDGQLCAGEAAAAIAGALRQGRVCDAFCLVRSVLQTYNPASPYVALDDWDGTSCQDCGRSVDREHAGYCEHCGNDYCDRCMSYCDACDGSCCRGCLERDAPAGTDLCPGCRTECGDCGRVVKRDEFHAGTGRCPQCCGADGDEEGRDEDDAVHEARDRVRHTDPNLEDPDDASTGSPTVARQPAGVEGAEAAETSPPP